MSSHPQDQIIPDRSDAGDARSPRRRRRSASTAIAASLIAMSAALASGPEAAAGPASRSSATEPTADYTRADHWACRPGAEDACTTGLDAVTVRKDGTRVPEPFRPAAAPAIDCFYVYPTVSREDRPYSDLAAGPAVMDVIRGQAGRLASRCRLFVPLYRQATLAHLRDRLNGRSGSDSGMPYDDIVAAWTDYLARDNRGRGVVLIGHSQGAILLQRLIAEHIDGTPVQSRLVSAFLAGDPSLGVPVGRTTGGTFAHVPVCTAAAQTGCAYAWGSYLDSDASDPRAFGHPRTDGLASACAIPAAPGGGSGTLKAYVPSRQAPFGVDVPWTEVLDRLTAGCRADALGAVSRVTVEPGPDARALSRMLEDSQRRAGWGLHRDDISLYLGNILELIDLETSAWTRGRD